MFENVYASVVLMRIYKLCSSGSNLYVIIKNLFIPFLLFWFQNTKGLVHGHQFYEEMEQ